MIEKIILGVLSFSHNYVELLHVAAVGMSIALLIDNTIDTKRKQMKGEEMKTICYFGFSVLLVVSCLIGGCAMQYRSSSSRFTKERFKIDKTDFVQKVHRIAFKGVEFNVDMAIPGLNEKQKLVQDSIMQYLLKLGEYDVIAPENCETAWLASLAELNIEGVFDPKTGGIDQDKYNAVSKIFMQKLGVDSWLYVSFVPGTVEQKYAEGQTQTTRTVRAVDIYANISDRDGNCLWESGAMVGALAKRNSFIFLGWDSNYTPERLMTEKNIAKAVKATFKSLDLKKK